uniref:Long-chain fatty acid--CoA ligase n=1 Tax=candidate division WOR-3 bacterium TaxID=2052148 RepID=A0A7V3RFZ4_UNCW3
MNSIYEAFLEAVKKYPMRTALQYKREGLRMTMSYQALNEAVTAVILALKDLNFKKGERIGILSYNRPEWIITDLATLAIGGIVVPIYHMPGHSLPPEYVRYILKDAGIKILFIENPELYKNIEPVLGGLNDLEAIVLYEGLIKTPYKLVAFGNMVARPVLYSYIEPPNGDDIATIVYTSGTTGEPKGVMLTHTNILSNARTAARRFHFTPDDSVISYLPLAHMFERTCGYYTVIISGGMIGFAEDITTVARDAEEIKPTIVLAVPRVIEKVYNMVVQKIEGGSVFKKGLVLSAVKNLNEYANLKYRKKPIPLWLKIKCSIYDKIVASKFRKIGGGRIRAIIVGGAPLNREIAKILYIFGFNIVEGYGLTETSPCVSCCTVEDNRLGTVGKPFEGVEVKIGENDEILVRGPNVMKGYYNKPEETAKVIDADGWFHTGDQGRFDEYGNLVITGRLKELIVLSGGKKVAPVPIEAKLTSSPYIEQAILCGDKRNYITGLLVPNQKLLENFAKKKNIRGIDYPELLKRKEIRELLKKEVEIVNESLASYEKIKAFHLLPEGFTVENGLLTATLKPRRNKIYERYAREIEMMYGREKSDDVIYL